MRLFKCVTLLYLLLILMVHPVFSGINFGTGHRHNFSKGSGGLESSNEKGVCVFCHTPHGSEGNTALWNRAKPTGGPFPIYGNRANIEIDDIAASGYNSASPSYPNGASRFCLSCHDGVSSVGTFLNPSVFVPLTMVYDNLTDYNSSGLSDNLDGTGMIVDLSVSHPVSFVYSASVIAQINAQKPGSYQPSINSEVQLDGQGRMQCTTCHDPHTDTRQGAYLIPFWASYTGTGDGSSDVTDTCNSCHTAALLTPGTDPHEI